MRQQEIARVEKVGSTPRGNGKEQREHLPPHQEQLFNPLRRGDAGMGGARKGEKVARKSTLDCFLCHLLTFTVSSNPSPTRYEYPVGARRPVVQIFFFTYLFSMKLRKQQLYNLQADVQNCCTRNHRRTNPQIHDATILC